MGSFVNILYVLQKRYIPCWCVLSSEYICMSYLINDVFEAFCLFLSTSVQSLSRVFATPWTAACQASLSITKSQSLLKLMSIESVMPSSHLILCWPLFPLPSIFPSIRVFLNESALCITSPKY